MEKYIHHLKKWYYKMHFQETANSKEVGLKMIKHKKKKTQIPEIIHIRHLLEVLQKDIYQIRLESCTALQN